MLYAVFILYKQDLFYSQKYAHSVSLYGAYYLFSHNINIQKTLYFTLNNSKSMLNIHPTPRKFW